MHNPQKLPLFFLTNILWRYLSSVPVKSWVEFIEKTLNWMHFWGPIVIAGIPNESPALGGVFGTASGCVDFFGTANTMDKGMRKPFPGTVENED